MKRLAENDLQEEPFSKGFVDEQGTLNKQVQGQLTKFIKSAKLISILNKKGVKHLFPIQYLTFSSIAQGKDIIARDKTGSGKTLAFSLPVIQRMRENRQFEKTHLVKFLIVLPTRELVIQVKDEIESLRFQDEPDFRIIAVYGKSDINYQIERIKKGIDIIVGTPGRLIDLLERDVIKMNQMQVLCLDEADEMLKQGFKEEVEKIYKYISDNAPKKTQNLLFSATIPQWLEDLSSTYLDEQREYVNLIKKDDISTPQTLDHYSMKISDDQDRLYKEKIIMSLMKKFATKSGHTLIFCERKIDATTLSNRLAEEGIKNQALHGDVVQRKRQQAYKSFKQGHLKVLVATNVCARGLDFPDIDLVIQSQPPNNPQPYIHRSGRTARKGKEGVCVTLFTPSKEKFIKNVQREAKIQFQRLRVDDFLPSKNKENDFRKKDGNKVERDTQQGEQYQLFIKYLPTDKEDEEIKQFFRGKGVDFLRIKVLKNGEGSSKGSAFIKFASQSKLQTCLSLDGCEFEGNHLSISQPSQK